MAETYDVIVIGGGHNGLVTAAYLAKGGEKNGKNKCLQYDGDVL